jgi:hypothetical protein
MWHSQFNGVTVFLPEAEFYFLFGIFIYVIENMIINIGIHTNYMIKLLTFSSGFNIFLPLTEFIKGIK